jgi:H/ACA ribonucleoprotein complex subunit 3
MKTVVYKQQQIQLDEKNSLGTGGEATVILHDKLAFKLYHTPSKERSEKLKDFLQLNAKLPDNVAFPIDLVFDTRSKVIGFTMPVANKCKEVINLSNKKYRTQEQVTSNDIVKVFRHIKSTVDEIHSNNLIIGDFNDLNVLFNTHFLSVFIDVDSFQFGNYPCPVGTDQFIDPSLYGIDLSKKPCFTKETDWYSFAVMLFKSLLFAHPYGGVHKTYQTLFDRAQQKITVFEKDVIYPKIAINPDTLSDELLDYFYKVFKQGKRFDVPQSTLQNLEFVKCQKCNNSFYNGRGQCPVCFGVVVKPVVDISQIITKKQIDDDKCIADTLFFTEGIILFSKVLTDNRIVIVEYASNQTNLHIINGKKSTLKLWSGHSRDTKYDFFQNYFVVSQEKDLMVFDVSSRLQPLAKTTTLTFDGMPVFCCSEKKLYRLTDKVLSICEVYNGSLVENVSIQTLENQTWLDVGSNDLGIGYFRIFDQYHYFVFSSKGRFEINLTKQNGKIIETCAEFSKSTVLFLQKTLYKGRTYSHYHIIDDQGQVLESKSEESISSDLLKNLSGKSLVGTTIVHPSDAGIVLEKKQQLALKKETSSYIDSNDKLSIYKDGILAVSEHKVTFLRLIK